VTENFWQGKRVLVTGHTGFKGGWLSILLAEMGAEITGYSLPPDGQLSFFEVVGVGNRIANSVFADINDRSALQEVIERHRPEVVFHLAAQALVRASYADPVDTFATNVVGVVNLLDAVRRAPSVQGVIIVTSDKCYENMEWVWGYRETDALGGRDPYSASKGCAEIVTRSMRMSFFRPFVADGHPARIASVRAGNVIGGGDWSKDRLVPDIVRGCLSVEGTVHLRNPTSVRPWQHVLDPLAAYVQLAQLLVAGADGADSEWNIGPDPSDNRAVVDVARAFVDKLGRGRIVSQGVAKGPHEATLLNLDCTKARTRLGWRSRLPFEEAIAYTVDWYAAWYAGADMLDITSRQIGDFAGKSDSAERTPVGSSRPI